MLKSDYFGYDFFTMRDSLSQGELLMLIIIPILETTVLSIWGEKHN